MLFLENIKLALSGLVTNKMRSFLTMLGIIIGIGSVIAIMTVGNSLSTSISTSMQGMGANNITVGLQKRSQTTETNSQGAKFGAISRGSTISEEDYITDEMLSEVKKQYKDNIDGVSLSESVGSGTANNGVLSGNVSVIGTNMDYYIENELFLVRGRNMTSKDISETKRVALVSDRLVDSLFDGNNGDALGKTINVNVDDTYYEYTIIGVYEYEESSSSYSSDSDEDVTTDVYIPISVAKEETHNNYGYQNFTIVTKVNVDSSTFATQLENYMNRNYYLTNDTYEISASSMESMISSMTDMLSTVSIAIAIIAGISLLVGGIGVMNIMLVSITERTREIGTRKALGATNGSIRLQFIVEAVVICLVGGLLGIILGVTLGSIGASVLGYSASPSVVSIVVSVVFSMVIGVFFGYYPANKAAKLNPIEALRYE